MHISTPLVFLLAAALPAHCAPRIRVVQTITVLSPNATPAPTLPLDLDKRTISTTDHRIKVVQITTILPPNVTPAPTVPLDLDKRTTSGYLSLTSSTCVNEGSKPTLFCYIMMAITRLLPKMPARPDTHFVQTSVNPIATAALDKGLVSTTYVNMFDS